MNKQLLYYLFLCCLWTSCTQEELTYPITAQQVPTDKALTDICFIDEKQGFVSTGDIFSDGVVFQTTNGGETWSVLDSFNRGIHSLSFKNDQLFIGETGQWLHQWEWPTGTRHSWSANGGWWPWHSQALLENGEIILVGGEFFGTGFIHTYTPNTNSLIRTDTFLHELQEIVKTPNGTLHVVGYGLVLRSTNNGRDWEVSRLQGDFFRGVDFPSDNVGYVVGTHGSVYKTTDGGISWKKCRAGNSLFANPNKLLRDIAFADEYTGFIVGTGSTVFRTTDGGKTWKKARNLDFKTDYQGIKIFNGVAYLLGHYGQLYTMEL